MPINSKSPDILSFCRCFLSKGGTFLIHPVLQVEKFSNEQ